MCSIFHIMTILYFQNVEIALLFCHNHQCTYCSNRVVAYAIHHVSYCSARDEIIVIAYQFIVSTMFVSFSTRNYPIGTVGALVIAAQKQGNVNILEIKDGHSDEDRAQVTINSNHFFNCTFSNYRSIYFTNTQPNILNSIYIFYAARNPSKFYSALHLSRRTSCLK